MMRQIGKQILTIAALAAISAMVGVPLPVAAGPLTNAVVTDPLTGVAIDGYDPVSYFADAEPQMGRPDFEYDWQGVPWYFENAANRDAFIRAPEVYAPMYGGHCQMSLARGYLSDGKPRIYLIAGQRLYLFYSAANRDAFLMSPEPALKSAMANWREFADDLVGN
jgi:YHS domain-containing protein